MLRTMRDQFLKCVEQGMVMAATNVFNSIQFFNTNRAASSFTPKWSDVPLQKSWAKTKPPLGWPRTTDSLCPACVKEARQKILAGEVPWQVLLHEKVGEISADIVERDGQVWMIKECPRHGKIEDLMAIDSRFLAWIEKNFPGRDLPAPGDKKLHDHGTSSIRHGRGSVLTIDLTNRCNMMCDPCFMDANQVGFVHELVCRPVNSSNKLGTRSGAKVPLFSTLFVRAEALTHNPELRLISGTAH